MSLFSVISKRHYRITGKALHQQAGVSENHISELRNGGNPSVTLVSKFSGWHGEASAWVESLHFYLLLAGEEPKRSSHSRQELRSLVLSATPEEKAEVLRLVADWVTQTRNLTEPELVAEAV